MTTTNYEDFYKKGIAIINVNSTNVDEKVEITIDMVNNFPDKFIKRLAFSYSLTVPEMISLILAGLVNLSRTEIHSYCTD